MFDTIVNFLAGIFASWVGEENTQKSWWFNFLKNGIDVLVKWQNAWMWALTGLAVLAGMFVDVADWITTALSSITLSGISAPSGSIFAPTAGFSTAYGFMDWVFPLHEILSALVFLMPLFLVINFVRLTRAVMSLIQIAGTGVNN